MKEEAKVRTAICLEEHRKILINKQKGQAREQYFCKSTRTEHCYDSTAVRLKVLV